MHQWGTNSEYNFPTLGKVEFVSFKLINAGMAGIVCVCGVGGFTHDVFGWGCAARSWKPLPYFRPKYTLFHTVFQTWISNFIPCFRPCNMLRFQSINVNRIYGIKDFFDAPNDVLFFFMIQCLWQHVTAKNGIPDQTDGIDTPFQTKVAKSIPCFRQEMLENDTLRVAHTYMAYIWEYPFTPKLKILPSSKRKRVM